MGSLWERLSVSGGEARLRSRKRAVGLPRSSPGSKPGDSPAISDLAAAELLASLAYAALGGDDARGQPWSSSPLAVPGCRIAP